MDAETAREDAGFARLTAPVTAADVDAHDAAATAFFAKHRNRADVRRLAREAPARPAPDLPVASDAGLPGRAAESGRRSVEVPPRLDEKRASRRAWYRENAAAERARHRRFRTEYPDRVREYQRRYREKDPARARAASRRTTSAWRDRNAAAARAAGREQAARRRAADPDLNRRYYHSNIEAERARSRDNARLRRRLEALGLPPRRIQRVFADERRANDTAATEFFTRPRAARERQDLELERSATPYARLAKAESRRRLRGEHIDPTELEHLRAAGRADARRRVWVAVLPDLVRTFIQRNHARIREEIRLDDVARRISGKPDRDAATELARRIRTEAFAAVAAELIPGNESEHLGELHALMFPRYTANIERDNAASRAEARIVEAQRILAVVTATTGPSLAR